MVGVMINAFHSHHQNGLGGVWGWGAWESGRAFKCLVLFTNCQPRNSVFF